MSIKPLKRIVIPPPPPPPTPQCCVHIAPPTHNKTWRQKRYGDKGDHTRCQRESVVAINGKHYCRMHGGFIALDKWLKGELIERVIKNKTTVTE